MKIHEFSAEWVKAIQAAPGWNVFYFAVENDDLYPNNLKCTFYLLQCTERRSFFHAWTRGYSKAFLLLLLLITFISHQKSQSLVFEFSFRRYTFQCPAFMIKHILKNCWIPPSHILSSSDFLSPLVYARSQVVSIFLLSVYLGLFIHLLKIHPSMQ